MKTYEEIKSELLEIAEVLKKYPENIQPQVFEILTKHFLGHASTVVHHDDEKDTSSKSTKVTAKKEPKPKTNGKSANKSKETISLVKDLNLRPSGKKSFKDFYNDKKPGAASEFNTVAVYYMTDILQLSGVTPSHIYTCYKEVGHRPPEAFVQSLRDTASKHGYIDTADTSNIKVPLRGKNFVEHDLPKQKSKK